MDLQHSLWLIAPEEVLSLAGLGLLLVAAWGGDRFARGISILSVATLVAAGFLVAPALCSGAAGAGTDAFTGQYRGDAFAAFAKLLIYAGASVTLIVAPAFFERWRAMRAEFPLLVLFYFTRPAVSVLARYTFFNGGGRLSGLSPETLGMDAAPAGGKA